MRKLTRYVEALPPADVVRQELARNLREQRLLKQLLRLSEQRERVKEVAVAVEQREVRP